MKKNVLVFGSIAGIIVSVFMFVSMLMLSRSSDFSGSLVFGYASMIIAFSFIFIGIRNYRNKNNNGFLSFGKGLQLGLLMTLIASSFYVLTWMLEFQFILPDFMDRYSAHRMEALRASGVSSELTANKIKEILWYEQMYQNPLMRIMFTYMEILPPGILITLISAAVLQKKQIKL